MNPLVVTHRIHPPDESVLLQWLGNGTPKQPGYRAPMPMGPFRPLCTPPLVEESLLKDLGIQSAELTEVPPHVSNAIKIPITRIPSPNLLPDDLRAHFVESEGEIADKVQCFVEYSPVDPGQTKRAMMLAQWGPIHNIFHQLAITRGGHLSANNPTSSTVHLNLPHITAEFYSVNCMLGEATKERGTHKGPLAELKSKIHSGAYRTLGAGRDSFLGFTLLPYSIALYKIVPDNPTTRTQLDIRLFGVYDLHDISHRANFIISFFYLFLSMVQSKVSNVRLPLEPFLYYPRERNAICYWPGVVGKKLVDDLPDDVSGEILFKISRENPPISIETKQNIALLYESPTLLFEKGTFALVNGNFTLCIRSVGVPLVALQPDDIRANLDTLKQTLREALAELQRLGLAHCDLRPFNIFSIQTGQRTNSDPPRDQFRFIIGDLEFVRSCKATVTDLTENRLVIAYQRENNGNFPPTAGDLDTYSIRDDGPRPEDQGPFWHFLHDIMRGLIVEAHEPGTIKNFVAPGDLLKNVKNHPSLPAREVIQGEETPAAPVAPPPGPSTAVPTPATPLHPPPLLNLLLLLPPLNPPPKEGKSLNLLWRTFRQFIHPIVKVLPK